MSKATHPTIVLNLVGLTDSHVSSHTPNLQKLFQKGRSVPLTPVTPAVTCSVQSSFLTGAMPSTHGIVGNGWYFSDLANIWFWRQSNALVSGEKVWEIARKHDPNFTCANMFWWYNMYSSVDYSMTPRPIYCADGRKLPDVYSEPSELRDQLQQSLGTFPLFNFWGPMSGIQSTQWIAEASMKVWDQKRPSLMLIYLPHLDYPLQKYGPNHPKIADELRALDKVCGQLIDFFEEHEARIMLLSEYSIFPVSGAVEINRIFRKEGWIRVREELGEEKLDAAASDVFAVADHQIAHIYVKSPQLKNRVIQCLKHHPGIEHVFDPHESHEWYLHHERSGDLVALAAPDKWFAYYYWLDDQKAPDFARTVDIHNKPGYDPVELFIDPQLPMPKAQIAWKLLKKKLGFRGLLDVIPLDSSLVKGSHGRVLGNSATQPVFYTNTPHLLPDEQVHATYVKELILRHLFQT